MSINPTLLNRAVSMNITSVSQFYECAEFQMITLFEELFGKDAKRVSFNTEKEEKELLSAIQSMIMQLSEKINFKINGASMEALSKHLLLHSIVPKGEDNIVMRDYFNPVLINHFNFFLYLSEYLHTNKSIIPTTNEAELKKHLLEVAHMTNILIFHPINQASIQFIIDKLMQDYSGIVSFSKSDAKKEFIKFDATECKLDFNRNSVCVPTDYQRLMMKRATSAFSWIQEQIVVDKVTVRDMTPITMRYYMYRFLEKEYFKMPYKLRCSVPAYLRHAVHSAISDLLVAKNNYMKTQLPQEPFGTIKMPHFTAWVCLRLDCENWLNQYNNRQSSVFRDIAAIKTLEMCYMRDNHWDAKVTSKRIKDVLKLVTSSEKYRMAQRHMYLDFSSNISFS